MNTYIFFAIVIRYLCKPHTPFFYDSELDDMCLQITKDAIVDQCNPLHCFIVDEDLIEPNEVVIVCFVGDSSMVYKFYKQGEWMTKGKVYNSRMGRLNCKRIIKEIVKEIKKELNLKKFDIYFTVDFDIKNTGYFKKSKLTESVKTIAKNFKQAMNDDIIVRYLPYGHTVFLDNREETFINFNRQMLRLIDSENQYYYVFFDKAFFDELYNKVESFIDTHEQRIINKIKRQYKVKSNNKDDLYVLYVLYQMKDICYDEFDVTQVNFLMKIWEHFKNKRLFKHSFIKLFDEEVTAYEKNKLEENRNLFIEEICAIFPPEVSSKLLYTNQDSFQGHEIILLLDALMIKEASLEKYIIQFISRLFSILVKHFESLSKIITGENIDTTIDINNLRLQTIYSYRKEYKQNFANLILELVNKKNDESIENMKSKCLEKILKFQKTEFFVVKEFRDSHFQKYLDFVIREQILTNNK